MNDIILRAVIPVAFTIFLGYLAGRIFAPDVSSLSQISVYVLAPALVTDSLYRTQLSAENIGGILGGFALVSLLIYILVRLIAKIGELSPTIYKSLLASSIAPNNGNMGLPISDYALGFAGLERAIVYMIGSSILLFGILPALLKGKSFLYGMRLIFRLPLIWAMLIGLALRFFQIPLPYGIDKSIEQLGRASIPVALIILGMQLASTGLGVGRYELLATSLRLLVAPLLGFLVAWFLGLRGLDLQVFIIQSAMPTAVNSVILVTEFGGDAARVAKTVVTTTVFSFLTLPLVFWLLINVSQG
jgi:predicted permease